ncbi:SusE domain-containing protein [Hymenobacter sp. ISL-91]|uniref:SusE domain-containing protein n=1 Tax=Hymenobacter sp. ISL-91 TaxID=2819151 RepID=UPI001BE5B7C9|nr:SusE domain-containing protein [Hymenobacter sp. ISL-91]MBT2558168.1 SusE domain-containing protein [Hymenobacter sp. ISL-91]
MRSLFTKLAGLAFAATVLLTSCEKEGDKITLNQTSSPELKASTTAPALLKDDAAKPAVVYTWTPAEYGFAAGPVYSLEFDLKGNNFKAPRSLTVGSGMTTYSLTVAELNDILNKLGQKPGVESQLEVRLKAALNTTTMIATSASTALKATPYENRELPADRWAIIGDATANGWGKETPMTYDFDRKVWTITLPLAKAEYKFRANNDWALNLGAMSGDDATKTAGPLKQGGDNIKITEAGTYTVTLNYEVTPATYTTVKQ